MGWITLHRDKGQSHDNFFRAEFPTMLKEQGEILASSTIKGVYYAAVRQLDTEQVWALVIFTQRFPNNRNGHNFGYKEASEEAGIGDHDAPAKVLDLLTPTTNEYALEWRAACRAKLARKLPTLVDGQKIRISQGLTFRVAGKTVDCWEFTYVSRPRQRNVFRTEHGFLVRVPNWADLAPELVGA